MNMKNKMVAESLNESVYAKLNEEMNAVSESIVDDFKAGLKKAFQGLNKQYESLDKENEKAVREFAWNAALKTYVANVPEAGRKALKRWAEKAPAEMLTKFLEKAASDKFYGRTSPTFIEGKLQVNWRPMGELNLESPFSKSSPGA
jgi:ADP-heptose:LPS heptosyltransferase